MGDGKIIPVGILPELNSTNQDSGISVHCSFDHRCKIYKLKHLCARMSREVRINGERINGLFHL